MNVFTEVSVCDSLQAYIPIVIKTDVFPVRLGKAHSIPY